MHARPQREPLRAMAEAALKQFEPANQALNARGRRAIDHRAPAYPFQPIGTRRSPQFTKTFRNKSPDLTKSYYAREQQLGLRFTICGYGNRSCGEWLNDSKKDDIDTLKYAG